MTTFSKKAFYFNKAYLQLQRSSALYSISLYTKKLNHYAVNSI